MDKEEVQVEENIGAYIFMKLRVCYKQNQTSKHQLDQIQNERLKAAPEVAVAEDYV